MDIKLIKPITYQKGTENITVETLNLDYDNLVGNDIFEVEKEMILVGHPMGNQFVQSPKALAILGAKAAGLPTYVVDNMAAQDTMKLVTMTWGFLMGLLTVSEPPKQLEDPQS